MCGPPAGQAAPEIPRLAPGATAVPLSSAQQRLNFLDQLRPGGTEYLMPAVWRLSGELDRSALELALGDLVRRHPQLRTRFPSRGGVAFQEELPRPGSRRSGWTCPGSRRPPGSGP